MSDNRSRVVLSFRLRPSMSTIYVSSSAGRIRLVTMNPAPSGAPPISLLRFGTWACLILREGVSRTCDVELIVEGENLANVSARPDIVHDASEIVAMHGIASDLERLAAIAELVEDQSIFDQHSTSLSRSAKYFKELDEETSPFLFKHRPIRGDLVGLAWTRQVLPLGVHTNLESMRRTERVYRTALIGHVIDVLWDRLWTRHRNAPRPRNRMGNSAQLAYLSELQLETFRIFVGGCTVEAAMDVYEPFACGDLHIAIHGAGDEAELFSNCSPNGPNVFCFAEFAFLAIEAGIDAESWRRLAPALVATQELYLRAFGEIDPVSGAPVPQPLLTLGSTPRRSLSTSVRRDIVTKYRDRTIEELETMCGENLRRGITLDE